PAPVVRPEVGDGQEPEVRGRRGMTRVQQVVAVTGDDQVVPAPQSFEELSVPRPAGRPGGDRVLVEDQDGPSPRLGALARCARAVAFRGPPGHVDTALDS